MRKVTYLCIAILTSLLIISCNNQASLEFDWLPSTKNEDEILLYDRFDQRIISYNTKTFSIAQKNEIPNYFQFEFNDPAANVYTTGHSIENHYKVIQKNHNKTIELLSMNPSEAIFPLALKDKSRGFFIVSYYDEDGKELYTQRTIYSMDFEKKKLSKLSNTEGFRTSSGVYYNGYLYFTTYIVEEDSYSLYRLDDTKLQNTPQLVLTKLEAPEIYTSKNKLWLSDKDSIYSDEKKIPKKNLNYFYNGKLIQIEVNSSGDLVLYVTDINSEKKENTFERIIDFKLDGNNMEIYSYDGVYSIKLQ